LPTNAILLYYCVLSINDDVDDNDDDDDAGMCDNVFLSIDSGVTEF